MKLLLCLAVAFCFTGCLSITGQIGYTDPKSGAFIGVKIGDGQLPEPGAHAK